MMVSLMGVFNAFRPMPRLAKLVRMAELNEVADNFANEMPK